MVSENEGEEDDISETEIQNPKPINKPIFHKGKMTSHIKQLLLQTKSSLLMITHFLFENLNKKFRLKKNSIGSHIFNEP